MATVKQKEIQVSWMYRGQIVEVPPKGAVGFIYIIYNTKMIDPECGHYYSKPYVGKKILVSTTRSKIGIREKKSSGTRKVYKTTRKDSGWQHYWGSCIELKEDTQKYGIEAFERHIIEWCYTKKYMSYAEMRHQVLNDVLTSDSYNGNILSRFFRKDCINEPKQKGEE